MPVKIGDVVTVRFPVSQPSGHEQEGVRPAVVVGIPSNVAQPRFPVYVVVPVTSDKNSLWAKTAPTLYVPLAKGNGNLRMDSIALVEQVRSVDRARLERKMGELQPVQLYLIQSCLKQIFSF